MTNSWPYPDFDAPDVEPDDSGYAYDDEISTSRLAHLHDTGKMCGECGAEFIAANGEPSCCEYCRNHGSELPLSKHEESNKAAHKAVARRRRKNTQRKSNGDS